jgi:two-component SAPR family response regulator
MPMKPTVQKHDVDIDVVLTVVEMPGAMNGFGFAKWARSVRPELKIILVGTPEGTTKAAADLCDDGPLLMKPYDHKIVLDHIKRLLAARAREGGK